MTTAKITFTILRNNKREVLPAIELEMDGGTWKQLVQTDEQKLSTWLNLVRRDKKYALMCLHPFDAESINDVRVESIDGKLI